MKVILNIVFAILLFFTVTSCKINNDKFDVSYLGGQIVNPKSSKVYFLKNDKILDSALLNKHNKFLFKLKNLNAGLYSFSHGNEYQYVYFNKNDSIIIRLNTWDFDESLVFSGKGAEGNNFLMNLFLNNEKEDKSFSSFYRLSSDLFNRKIDSVLQIKNNLYKQFKANTKEESDYFNKLVEVVINYPLFRKKINLNDSSLVYFYPFRNYISSYLHHKAYEEKAKYPDSNFSINILNYTSKLINEKQLKNVFLYKFISDSFINYELTVKQRDSALKIFYKNCTNPEMLKEIKQLAFDYSNIKKGTKLFDFKVINTNGEKLNANSIFKNKKTVLYFWSDKFINANNLSKRITYLKNRYSKLNFIGINIDKSKTDWLKSPVFNTLNAKNQFQLTQKCVMRNFITARTPRIILLNNNAIVKNGFTVFWSRSFNKELDKLEKN